MIFSLTSVQYPKCAYGPYWKWNPIENGVYIWVEVSFSFQLLGECHCWWTRESLRVHVAKFYGRLRLIRSILRASKFSEIKLIEIVIFVGLLHHHLWFKGVSELFEHAFHLCKVLCFSLGSLTRVQYPKCAYGPYWKLNPIENGVYIWVEVSFSFEKDNWLFKKSKYHCVFWAKETIYLITNMTKRWIRVF